MLSVAFVLIYRLPYKKNIKDVLKIMRCVTDRWRTAKSLYEYYISKTYLLDIVCTSR